MRITVIVLIIFFSSCKSNYTVKEKNNIKEIDSISKESINDRIIDFKEDYEH